MQIIWACFPTFQPNPLCNETYPYPCQEIISVVVKLFYSTNGYYLIVWRFIVNLLLCLRYIYYRMSDLYVQLSETVAYLKETIGTEARLGIILGSGLSNLAKEIKVEKEIEYSSIPHFPVSTVKGHSGKLIVGEFGGKKILVLSGRFHFYEGYQPNQVTYPVRTMKLLGVETLLLSNAVGTVNPSHIVGDLMLITDHISFFQPNPLIGPNLEELGTRFPDMSEPYSKALVAKAAEIANEIGLDLKQGTYVGVTGPTFETRAEYQLIKAVGGDVVGMSTVQECITAVHCGMKVLAVSVITDIGIRDEHNTITHEEVLMAAREAEPKLTKLFRILIERL